MNKVRDVVVNETNVFTNMPIHGTVVAQMSKEDMRQYLVWADTLMALRAVGPRDQDAVNKVKDLSEHIHDFWVNFCRTNSIPFAWPFNIDYVSGNVYIDSRK